MCAWHEPSEGCTPGTTREVEHQCPGFLYDITQYLSQWVIEVNGDDDTHGIGYPIRVSIQYCPWCGEKLPIDDVAPITDPDSPWNG